MTDGTTPPAETPTEATPASDDHSHIPEKFHRKNEAGEFDLAMTARALAESYTSLEGGKPAPNADEAAAAVGAAGLDMQAFYTEFADTGAVSEESYAKLAAAGFDKNLVDNYVAGQAALAAVKDGAESEFKTTAFEPAGGEEGYAALSEWAAENLTDDELAGYNRRVSTDNAEDAAVAVKWLVDKRAAVDGSAPAVTVDGTVPGGANSDVYADQSEVTAAMNKRDDQGRRMYGFDMAYSKQVQDKVFRSNLHKLR